MFAEIMFSAKVFQLVIYNASKILDSDPLGYTDVAFEEEPENFPFFI